MHWKYETHYLIFYAKFESTPIPKEVRVPVSMYIWATIVFRWRVDSGPRLDAGWYVPMRPKIVIFLSVRFYLSGHFYLRALARMCQGADYYVPSLLERISVILDNTIFERIINC